VELKKIPVIHDVTTPVKLADTFNECARNMLDVCYSFYTKPLLVVADKLTSKWLAKAKPPYMDEIYQLSEKLGPGVITINLSYEWGCTTAAHDDPSGNGVRLIRTLDWPIKGGMGDKIIVAKQKGPAGEFYNMTYPGFVGVLNAVAPGRFAIAINSAPIPVHGWTKPVDWLIDRMKKARSNDIPAPFLLRKVFEECATYDDAVRMLSETPICTAALFTISGINKGEHAVIERRYDEHFIHKENSCTSNMWINNHWKGQGRHNDPEERLRFMRKTHRTAKGNFDWLQPPVKNKDTVLVFEANAKTGSLRMFGAEGGNPVTQTLEIIL